MEIVRCEPALAAPLAAAYNAAVRDLPHCYPVRADAFAAMVEGEEAGRGLRRPLVLVAWERDAVIGWVHAGLGPERHAPGPGVGVIRFLWYARGERLAGQALLEAAEAHLRGHGMPRVVAFPQRHRYPFYHLDHAYLSDRLEHVLGLLGRNSYRRAAGEVFYDWPAFAPELPALPDLPIQVVVTPQPGRGSRPGLRVHARLGDDPAGECVCSSCAEYAPDEHLAVASEWGFVDWLNVPEPLHARGLGRYLLGRALCELRALGYRHAAISSARDNYRAILFYSNFGFHAVDWTYGLAREWEG
jgi:GNAT superfamily N-acetyltransferase